MVVAGVENYFNGFEDEEGERVPGRYRFGGGIEGGGPALHFSFIQAQVSRRLR
jgi:hypothetical protein